VSQVLILADDAEAQLLVQAIANATDGPFDTHCETLLSSALSRIAEGGIDIILVKLNLPDSTGLATFDALFQNARHTPIMTLAESEGELQAREAVQRGAQGYLSRGHYGSSLLPQALRNIIQRKAVEEDLYKERARAEVTLNAIGDAVISTDTNGNVTYLNPMAESLTGWTRADAIGQPVVDVLRLLNSETNKLLTPHPVLDAVQNNEARGLALHTTLVAKNGYETAIEDSIAPIIDWDGKPAGAVVVLHDVTESRALSARMAHQANHDFLTGLPNRVLLTDRLLHEITWAQRHASRLAVLFLDLDNFKHINDSLGHDVGDKLLQAVAEKLRSCVRSMDTVSRLGGDEFVILLAESVSVESVAMVADKIRETLSQPHLIGGHELYVTTSMGACIYPGDGQDVGTLIKNADTAMYSAKEKGRNNCQFFDHDMNARTVERQLIESSLRLALKRQEFVLHYQPKVDLASNRVTGAEALLRWKHPEWGMVFPERFITIAEECGLIVPIGSWVLREACTEAKRWFDAGMRNVSVAVNISALEFRQKGFLASVRQVLTETGLPASCMQLEITESVVMRDAQTSAATLRGLKETGVRLAVDDFGTGYSSLSYLKQFPIDILKIDQSFVRDITNEQEDGAIVTAIIVMGNSLNQLVVAEGIENDAQLSFLKTRGCGEGQGYLFSAALPAEQFAAFAGIDMH
jgi:diguanylate cyclase (GGDEF)-like protein/PAS domain S-box-containing protein